MKEVSSGPEGHQLLSNTGPGAQGPLSLRHTWWLRLSYWKAEFTGLDVQDEMGRHSHRLPRITAHSSPWGQDPI